MGNTNKAVIFTRLQLAAFWKHVQKGRQKHQQQQKTTLQKQHKIAMHAVHYNIAKKSCNCAANIGTMMKHVIDSKYRQWQRYQASGKQIIRMVNVAKWRETIMKRQSNMHLVLWTSALIHFANAGENMVRGE
jgi:ATP-dependent 26S proteasome regulatory subunit